MNGFFLKLVWLLFLFGCHAGRHTSKSGLPGPNSATLDLYRNPTSKDKLFVEVRLHDGKPRLFLVDTGSSITTVSKEVAVELQLAVAPRPGQIVGIGGATQWMGGILAAFKIGPYTIRDLPVAVGVPGIPSHVGIVPLAGILGNDVLGQFQVVVDYPANQLQLAKPNTMETPDTGVAMFFNGQHPMVQTTLTARNQAGTTVEQPVFLEIDTGARGLLLMGGTDTNLGSVASEGNEPITGVGADNSLPSRGWIRETRRVPISRFSLGGKILEGKYQAVWIDHNRPRRQHAPGMPGLAGYQALKGHRVFLDYPARSFALLDPVQQRPKVDVHQWFLRRSDVASDSMDRIKALLFLGQSENAVRRLEKLAKQPAKYPAAVSMLSRNYRANGSSTSAHALLERLSVRDLVEHGEIVAWVNGLWLRGNTGMAIDQAQLATVLSPTSSQAWLSLSDVSMATGQIKDARLAIAEAVRLDGDPDAHLLRRAFIASMDGDNDGAMTHFRRAIRLQPQVGYAHWLYALLASDSERLHLIKEDIEHAETRLHPGDGPLDFWAGAWARLDETERAERYFQDGLTRDCARARDSPSQQNCTAWYYALIQKKLDEAHDLVSSALVERPNRAEYLDTLAIVLEAQGRSLDAREAAWKAAAQVPDDVYLVTQALRLQADLTPTQGTR